jgi:hypothetical protein
VATDTKMKYLLKLKHWQIFLLSWGPLTTVLVILFKVPDLILAYFPFVLAAFLIGLANSFAWVWIVVVELNKVLTTINTRLFKIAFWIPFVYIWAFIAFMLFNLFVRKVKSLNQQQVEVVILIAWAVLSVCCIIYGLVFIGRIIKAVELNRKPSIKEHVLESLLMLFPPLGLWVLQPKLNKIIDAKQQ